jgi:L-threonylcarbamoyladenylate synthase
MDTVLDKLFNGNTILYPTDTVWGLGCDATEESAVEKIYQIKQRAETKSMIVLVNSITMLREYVDSVPETALKILEDATRPTTIVYPNPKGLAKNVIAKDNTVAIRIVEHEFCERLIFELGKPLVSTSANISGEPTPKSFGEISQAILDSVDYVVDLHDNSSNGKSSRILKLNIDGSIEVIRD